MHCNLIKWIDSTSKNRDGWYIEVKIKVEDVPHYHGPFKCKSQAKRIALQSGFTVNEA